MNWNRIPILYFVKADRTDSDADSNLTLKKFKSLFTTSSVWNIYRVKGQRVQGFQEWVGGKGFPYHQHTTNPGKAGKVGALGDEYGWGWVKSKSTQSLLLACMLTPLLPFTLLNTLRHCCNRHSKQFQGKLWEIYTRDNRSGTLTNGDSRTNSRFMPGTQTQIA